MADRLPLPILPRTLARDGDPFRFCKNEKPLMNLPTCLPPPATGVHHWIYGRALFFYRQGATQAETEMRIRAAVESGSIRAGRTVEQKEIADAITSVWRSPYGSLGPTIKARTSANYLPAEYSEAHGWASSMSVPVAKIDMGGVGVGIASSKLGLADLWDMSPIIPPIERSPMLALNCLFKPDDILCLGKTNSDFEAKQLKDWTETELMECSLIVPNPLRKMAGRTKSGAASAHCRDATGPRRYLILESDAGLDLDEQARLIYHIVTTTKARLACAAQSGGKSLHGWIHVDGFTERQIYSFMTEAARLGFDPRLFLPEQFVRLPDGLRNGTTRQTLSYLCRHE
jgi:hypothetical protein